MPTPEILELEKKQKKILLQLSFLLKNLKKDSPKEVDIPITDDWREDNE